MTKTADLTPRMPHLNPEIARNEAALRERLANAGPPPERVIAPLRPDQVDALLATLPELAALNRLCQQVSTEGHHLDPVWVVGPLASTFVGRVAATPFELNAVQVRYEDLPGTPEQRHEVMLLRRTDQALAGITRHLAGMEPDEPLVPNHGWKDDHKCSPLLRNDYPGIPVALSRPPHSAFSDRVDNAAADFQPRRDCKVLDGRLACLLGVGNAIRADRREKFIADFRTVAAVLAGPTRWGIADGWDGQTALALPWQYRFNGNACALWADRLLRYPAALNLIVNEFCTQSAAKIID